jgi:hypothetical protein
LSRRAILIIVLIIETLFPHLPLQPVAAAESTIPVSFQWSWSGALWKFQDPLLDWCDPVACVANIKITPDFCAGAFVGAGWPFQFTGQYPDSVEAPGNVHKHDHVGLMVDNLITPSSPSLNGCDSASNPNVIFEAFAGIKLVIAIHLEASLPHIPDPPDCKCDGWPWHWPCCVLKGIWKAAQAVFNSFMDAIAWVLSQIPGLKDLLPFSHDYNLDLGDYLMGGGKTFMEIIATAQNSPLEQQIPLSPGVIGPDWVNFLPPFISHPGVADIGVEVDVGVTPHAGSISGVPHMDDGGANVFTAPYEGERQTEGAPDNLHKFSDSYRVDFAYFGVPPSNNAVTANIYVQQLQQPISVSVGVTPKLVLSVLAWDIDLPGFGTINLGSVNDNLPGQPDLLFQTTMPPGATDLIIDSVQQDTSSSSHILLNVGVKNLGIVPAAPAGYKSLAIYEIAGSYMVPISNFVAKVSDSSGNPIGKNQYYPANGIEVPLSKLSSSAPGVTVPGTLIGHHALQIIVNPDHAIPESNYDNNGYLFDLLVAPDLRPTQYFIYGDLTAGKQVSIQIDEQNIGLVDCPPVAYQSYAVYEMLSPDLGTLLAKNVYQDTTPPPDWLKPSWQGGWNTIWTHTVWTGSFPKAGTYQIQVVVNPDNAVDELDYTNNALTIKIVVKAPPVVMQEQPLPPPPPQKFDFTVTVGPGGQSVTRGGSVTYRVVIGTAGTVVTLAQSVTLTVKGLPAGATASFSPSTGNPTFISVLTIKTAPNTPLGTYTLTITGAGGGVTHSRTVTLSVIAAIGVVG